MGGFWFYYALLKSFAVTPPSINTSNGVLVLLGSSKVKKLSAPHRWKNICTSDFVNPPDGGQGG